MFPSLIEKEKDAPGMAHFFSFSAKVQNYAELIQKIHFRLKKNPIFARDPIVPQPTKANESQQRPTKANKGQ